MKKPILSALRERRLYFDGATGSQLQSMGLPVGTPPEAWSITHPDTLTELHRAYLSAGADIIKTNTFGVNPLKYENYADYIRAAVGAARRAAQDFPDAYVALDIGPLARLIAPLGDLPFEAAVEAFSKTVRAAEGLGVDLILIETMNDSYETKAAVLGAKEASSLPIFVTNVYDSRGKLMTGATPAAMVALLEGLGVSALGMNCSLGPDKMLQILPELTRCASVPVIVNPNAGLPEIRDGKTVYNVTKEEFAAQMARMAECGASVLGGCCGTSPEYIRELRRTTEKITYTYPVSKNITAVSSYTHAVEIGSDPILIGERINPTGKPRLKAAIREGNLSYILSEALGQTEAGAHILDVNVGLPEIDEPEVMRRTVLAIQSVTDTPLEMDSSDPSALEAAMRIYNGKPLVNSVNGKREVMDAVFPLVKKYGGVLVALTLDEQGIPDTAEGRVRIAERIIAEAARYGIEKKDIIVDPLTLSVSADPRAATVTLAAVKILTERGINTSLGVSNISFGLPARDKINSAFFTGALTLGLSAAIMNPYSEPMMDAYRAHRALAGLDTACSEYIAKNAEQKPKEEQKRDTGITLSYAVRHGMRREASTLAAEAVKSADPLEIVNGQIIPALNEIGSAFERGEAYLPELLMSAEAASEAFAAVKSALPKRAATDRKIVVATVKGDIHDIGKNIVRVMLESYGFTVIDLGKDVAPEAIVAAAREHGADLVGLSALMTTTVPAMRQTVDLLHRDLPDVRVMVGGAVLTPDYARELGADYYAADAMEGVRIAEELFGRE